MHPTLDLELFALRNFRWGNLSIFSFSIAFTAMFVGSILFMAQAWNWSILQAGFAVAPGPALLAVLALRSGTLAGKLGQRPMLIAGGLLLVVTGLMTALLAMPLQTRPARQGG